MQKSVYKITDKNGFFYIGSSINPRRRLGEHRYRNIRLDKNSMKLEIICTTKNFIKLEESLIKNALLKNDGLCVNKTTSGCGGFHPMQMTEKRFSKASNNLKNRWKDPEQKKIFMAGIEKSRKINNLFEMSKKSQELKWSKMPEWTAICKKTGKIFGPYRGYKFAKEELGCSIDAIFKSLRKNNVNKKYEFKYLEVTDVTR